ncbi:hypothetical protein C4565_01765 [Candidatus Parcubacteria bacterium]|jgi:murein DD-endopeptidase MepM/ murein hydrolase activator NlpD|nr:MAG: hypothetical protein C4565_01765 [Candidatus Parcubacteria bacterium]
MNKLCFSCIIGILCIIFLHSFFYVHAETSGSFFSNVLGDLEKNINEKSTELQKIKEQRDLLQRSLDAVSEVGSSLKKDIQTYNTSINQLNLSIKSSSVHIEKLNLEIDVISDEIQSIKQGTELKKYAIARLMGEIQQADNESLIERLLKSESLSDSIAKIENIRTLNSALSNNIKNLQSLQTEYKEKLETTKNKVNQKEVQKETLKNLQQITAEQKTEKQKLLEVTKSQEQIYQQQIDKLDAQQGEISSIITEFEDKLRASFNPSLLPTQRPGVLGFPVESPYITQCYGPTSFAIRAYRTKSHNGIDFGTPVGTPVLAAESGTIARTGNNDRGTSRWSKYQYGKYIVVEHENNLATLYAHLSSQVVKAGDRVEKGQIIGYSGNTGYSTGPHLHFSVLWAQTLQYKSIPPAAGLVPVGVNIDPAFYLQSLSGFPKGRDSGCK